MAINKSIYGAPNTWVDYGTNISDIKVANFGTGYNLAHGIINGKLSYDTPLDNSISFCGIGKECPLSNLVYYHGESGTITNEVKTALVTNYFLNTIPSAYNTYWDISAAFTMYDDSNTFDLGTWSKGGDSQRNANNFVQPVTDFKPQNIVLCIFVDCKQTQNGAINTVTLSKYINDDIYLQYPYVERVIGGIYIGNYTSGGTNTRTTPLLTADFIMSISTLDPFESTYIDNCYRYNSLQANNENIVPLLFSALRTINFAYNNVICFGDFTSDNNFEVTQDNNNVWRMSYHVTAQNIDNFKEMCLRAAAQYGLYFTDDEAIASTGSFTDENMYIGLLDSDLISHGDYAKGLDTLRAVQNTWDTIRDSNYNPDTQIIDYDTRSHYGSLSYHNFNRMYSLTDEQVTQLNRIMSAAMSAKPTDMSSTDYSKDTFLTNNPIDCIVSLRKYPIVDTSASASALPVKFGGYTSDINAPYAATGETIRYDFTGSKAFEPIYGNSFLDRAPYTTAELFVPFCGNIKLDTDTYIGHAIGVKLVVDYLTGSCTAYIERDGIPMETINGTIGLDVPVTGVQTQTLTNTIMRNVANSHAAQVSAIQTARGGANIVSVGNFKEGGNVLSPVLALAGTFERTNTAMESADIAEYQLYHTEIPFKSVSAGSAFTAGSGEWVCRLSITRPVLSPDYDPEIYGKTVGFACLINGKVSDFTGLTVGIIDLSGVNCSDREKELISNAFKHGVIL